MTDVLPGQTGMFEEEPKAPRTPTDNSAMVQRELVIPSSMGVQIGVATDLVPLLVDIKSVRPHPKNIRIHKLDAIVTALDKYGIMSPIVVQASTRFVCKGNGTLKAAQVLGCEQIPASIVDIDDETAWEYLLDDNRASDLAENDPKKLTEALVGLYEANRLENTLWTIDDMEDAQARSGQITVLEPQFVGEYALDAETMAARRARVTERTGTKMRQTSVVLTVKQHEAFMQDIALLQKVYNTTGVIATVVEAVKREAAFHELAPQRQPEEATADELAARI